MSVCLDTYALLAWVQGEPAAERVDEHLRRAPVSDGARCLMAAVHLGEAFCILGRRADLGEAELLWDRCTCGVIPVTVVETTLPRVRAAARVKVRHRLSSPSVAARRPPQGVRRRSSSSQRRRRST